MSKSLSRAWRLILARSTRDAHAESLVEVECDPDDWRHITDHLLDVTAALLTGPNGAGDRLCQRQIELALYCQDRDRNNLPPDIGVIDRQFEVWDAYERERTNQ